MNINFKLLYTKPLDFGNAASDLNSLKEINERNHLKEDTSSTIIVDIIMALSIIGGAIVLLIQRQKKNKNSRS